MYELIVVGTDLSNTSLGASHRGASLAKAMGAELTLVYFGSHPGDRLRREAESRGGTTVVRPTDFFIVETT